MKFSLTAAMVLAFVALLAAVISPHSGLVFVWWATLTAAGHRYLLRKMNLSASLLVFAFYSLLAIVLYQTQLWTNPAYYGFSGGWGVGTDDSFFYSLVAPDLPYDFPTRFAIMVQRHNYGDVLGILVAFHRRIFPTLHPLDLLFFNTCVLSFLPFVTRELYREIFPGERGSRWAFGMTTVAPFILANGVILMRDGLVATFFAAGLLAVMRRNWLAFVLLLSATAWLRPQNGIMLTLMAVVLGGAYHFLDRARKRWLRSDSPLRLGLMGVGGLVVLVLIVQVVFQIPWWQGFFRGDFLQGTLRERAAAESGPSTFLALSQLPLPLRVVPTLLFYLGSPFLALGALKTNGLWIPRSVLSNFYALLFPLYAAWFYRSVMRIFRSHHRGAIIFLALFLFSLSLVTQASMQMRHKIPLQPMFYVLVAYGVATPFKQDRSLGWFIALVVLLVDLAFNVLLWI